MGVLIQVAMSLSTHGKQTLIISFYLKQEFNLKWTVTVSTFFSVTFNYKKFQCTSKGEEYNESPGTHHLDSIHCQFC